MEIDKNAPQSQLSFEIGEYCTQLINLQLDKIILVNPSGIVLFSNAAAQAKLIEKIIGTSIWEIIPKAQKNRFKLIMTQVISTGIPQLLKYQDGGKWYQTTLVPIKDKNGLVASIGLISRDIDHLIQVEEQLKKKTLELATAKEDERHRISRDLHDEIGQRMTALLLQLGSLKEKTKNQQIVKLEEICSASQSLEIIIKHLRQIFFQLYPPSLSRVSLPKVLEALCSSVEESNGLKIDLSYQDNIPDLQENQLTTIYRFVQEGLTNIVKHSRAKSAWINLDYTEGDINISIEDDGVGFSMNGSKEGIGLRGIRERFMLLNGNFEIESAVLKGTRLSGSIPLTKKAKKVKN